jgi:O-antigen/teichoic acid export membrane protein
VRKLAAAFAQLALSSIFGQVIGFAVLVVVARDVGPANLGAYGFANNVIPYVLMPVVGITAVATRDVARDPARASATLGTVTPILAAYSLVACLVLYLLAPLFAPTHVATVMLRILDISIALTLLTPDWLLQGLPHVRALALARLAGQVAYGITAALFLEGGTSGAYRYAWLNMLGLGVAFALIVILSVHAIGRPGKRPTWGETLDLLRLGVPFMVSLLMVKVYYSADFVLLGLLSTTAAVGQYTVAYKLPLSLLGFAAIWNGIVFSHSASQHPGEIQRQLGIWTTLTLIALIPICIGSVVLAHPLIAAFFGPQYRQASLYFTLLMVAVAVALINGSVAPVMLATGSERVVTYSTTAGAVLNLLMNLALIPLLGPEGSAIATIAAESAVTLGLFVALRSTTGLPTVLWSRVARAGLSGAIMAIVLIAIPALSVFLMVAVGALVFSGAALVTGAIRPSDRTLLMSPAARQANDPPPLI